MPSRELLFKICRVDNKIKDKREPGPSAKCNRDGDLFKGQSNDIAICQSKNYITDQWEKRLITIFGNNIPIGDNSDDFGHGKFLERKRPKHLNNSCNDNVNPSFQWFIF